MNILAQLLFLFLMSIICLAVLIPGLCSVPECSDLSFWQHVDFYYGVSLLIILWIVGIVSWIRKYNFRSSSCKRNFLYLIIANFTFMLDVYSIDQTQELQDLIDQHIISGQPLKLNNNYQIVNPVEITGTLTVDGNGKTIILDCKNSALKDMIFVHGSPDSIIENIKIINLNLDQNLGIGSPECSRGQLNKLFRNPKNRGKGRAIKIAYANNVIIEDVVINNSWIGLEFADGTSNATATRVYLNNVLEDGFEITINIDINNPMRPHDIQYFDCHVRSILDFDSGFEIEAASHVEVLNSSVNNCGADNRGSSGDGIVLKRTHNDTTSGLPLGNSDILIDNFCSRTKTNNYSIYINNGDDIAIINNARLNGGLKFEPWINLTEYSSYHGAHSEVERICNNLNAPGIEGNIYKDRYCQDLR